MYAKNLKKIREELGLSVAKFAKKVDMSANTLTGYERGTRLPSINLCVQLYKNLNVNLNWFISGEGEMFNTVPSIDSEKLKQDLFKDVKQMLQNEGIIK